MRETSHASALVVGSLSRDFAGTERIGAGAGRPGGVVHHAGCALAQLGAQTRVVTRLAPADAALLEPLRRHGVELLALPSQRTTSYRNDYTGEVDRHALLAVSDPIGPDDIPPAWRRADLVQLGPLHPRDLQPRLALGLEGLVGLDIQGLVRRLEGGPSTPLELGPWLAGVKVVKASEVELPALLQGDSTEAFLKRSGCSELLVTCGARGARVIGRGLEIAVPAAPAQVRDATGAGDVFLASYLLARVCGRSPAQAGRLAARASAAKIEARELAPAAWRLVEEGS